MSKMLLLIFATVVACADAVIIDGSSVLSDEFELQVAFQCGYPSAYLTKEGWVTDRAQSCLENPVDILAYCASKSPGVNFTNVIPAANEVMIASGASFASDEQRFRVRPYRCIVDAVNDALVVPDQCRFVDAKPQNLSTSCASYGEWNVTASQYCANASLTLYSFSVTSSCGVGQFRGYEAVCCPAASRVPLDRTVSKARVQLSTPQPKSQLSALNNWNYYNDEDYDVYDEEEDDDVLLDGVDSQWSFADADSVLPFEDVAYDGEFDEDEEDDVIEAEDDDFTGDFEDEDDDEDDDEDEEEDEEEEDNEDEDEEEADDQNGEYDYEYDYYLVDEFVAAAPGENYDPSKNYLEIYMNTPELLGRTEREALQKAVRYLKIYYDSEKQKLMQQLAEIELRADELDAKNATYADQIRLQGIATIRQLYDTTESTWKSVLKAMLDKHSVRVGKVLDDTRVNRENAWHQALEEAAEFDDLEVFGRLMRFLKQYIRSEEYERIHWINRYEDLLDNDPEEAERIRLTVQEMLRQIQLRLDSVASSLKRLPRLESTMRLKLDEYLKLYADVDQEIGFLFPDFDLTNRVAEIIPPRSTKSPSIAQQDNRGDFEVAASQFKNNETAEPAMPRGGIFLGLKNSTWLFICLVGGGAIISMFVTIIIVRCLCNCRCKLSKGRNDRGRLSLAVGAVDKADALGPTYLPAPCRIVGEAQFQPLTPPISAVYAQTTFKNKTVHKAHGCSNPLADYVRVSIPDSLPLMDNDTLDENSHQMS